MNRTIFVVIFLLAAAGVVLAQQPQPDAELGLSKDSVFETSDPILATLVGGDPGENDLLEAYFEEGIPPMIPHTIEDMVPIHLDENLCMDCHADKDAIGVEVAAGDPTPIPLSHYTDLRQDPDTVTDEVVGARWVCVQCHATQTDAAPLVENTYQR